MTRGNHAMPGPDDVTRVTLDNGMIVLVRENPSAPVAVLEGCLPVGSIYDPVEKAGLCSFTASLLTRGSAHYDFDTFNETIESVGASLGASSDNHTTNFSVESLNEDFPRMVEILADVLRRPVFPPEQVERVRRQWLVRLQEREQNTRQMAYLRFHELLYGQHPYGRSVSGYPETISAIGRDDVQEFHQQRYTPRGGIIVVAGDVHTEAVLDLLDRHLADWTGPEAVQELPDAVHPGEVQRLDYDMPGKVQSDLVIGCLAVARSDPDYYAVQVANHILGRFGMMGRLGETVREKQGLAYYCYSTLDADQAIGPWMAVAGVNPANVEQAVESIRAEFRRLGAEPVTAEELADSQANMTGSLPLRLETNSGVAGTLLDMEWFGLGLDYLMRYPDLIGDVTVKDVQRVAARYWRPDAYSLVVAGPPQ